MALLGVAIFENEFLHFAQAGPDKLSIYFHETSFLVVKAIYDNNDIQFFENCIMHPSGRQQKSSLFKEKVVVCKENFSGVNTDVVINFCAPNIVNGPEFFDQIHKMAGPNLMEACQEFLGIAPTSCRVTKAFNASNFMLVIHSVVPVPLNLQRPLDLRKVYLCVRNALDTAAEENAKTIAFPSHIPGVDLKLGSELILRIFTDWIHRSYYSNQINEIKVICATEKEYSYFVNAARSLYSEAKIVSQNYVPSFMRPSTVVIPSRYIGHGYGRMRRSRRTMDVPLEPAPIKLELSAKLAPTILVIDDENGLKRQYRLTNRSRDGRKLYFRCSRCDTLIKKDGRRIRAKLIVQDGHIVSDRYPEHHPDCEAKTHEDVFMQQVDRSSRREVKEGFLLPQDAYKKAIDRVLQESVQDASVDGAVERFPEWPRLRQQYCRIRKTALGKRLREQQQHNGDNYNPYAKTYSNQRMFKKGKYSPSYEQDEGGVGENMLNMVDYDDIDRNVDVMGMHDGIVIDEAEYALLSKVKAGNEMIEQEEDDAIINVDDDMMAANAVANAGE